MGDTVHHSPLQANQVRVCIDDVVEGFNNLRLPFPNDEQEYLGHAKGGFTIWPASYVELCDQVNIIY